MHEIYSLNLYPGPSAKKGIYGALINIGEQDHWTTLHGSTVEVVTPYDNIVTIMHDSEPLVMLNIGAVQGSTCLIWEHTEDEPGKPCPNPLCLAPRFAMC